MILNIIFLIFFSVTFSQSVQKDSLRGQFTYLGTYKPNSLNRDNIYSELFSLQISEKQAFFISENRLKLDSVLTKEFKKGNKDIDLRNISSLNYSNFLIIQKNDHSEYYDQAGMVRLFYVTPSIKDWKLINETKIINSLECKKAEVRYKGRDWIAWYCPKIPFPYGPYKFGGLPGLIVKMTDKTGDYDFELVTSTSSSNLKGKVVSVNKYNYENAKLVTKKELI